MVDVPTARKYGFRMTLHEDVMRQFLNGPETTRLLGQTALVVKADVETHVRATAKSDDADNYAAALFAEDAYSDQYGFDFDGRYELGSRPIAIVGVPSGRGPNPSAKPPLMVEAETHALTSVPGFTVGSSGEDIR